MTDPEAVFEDVQFLTGSPHRRAILRELCTDSYRPGELTDAVAVTRTTVQRVLAGFLDRRWVTKRDGEYRATLTGERVAAAYEELTAEVRQARKLGPLADQLAAVGGEVPTAALAEGDVTVASERNPLAVVDAFVEWFEACAGGDVTAASPIVTGTLNDAAADLLDRGTKIDLIIDADVLDHSADAFPDAMERAITNENVATYVHPEPIPFGMAVCGDRVCFAAYDESNAPRALVACEDERVEAWASERLDAMQSRGEPLVDVLDVALSPRTRVTPAADTSNASAVTGQRLTGPVVPPIPSDAF